MKRGGKEGEECVRVCVDGEECVYGEERKCVCV